MNNLTLLVEQIPGNSRSEAITIGDIKGLISKLPRKNLTDLNIGIKENREVHVCSLPLYKSKIQY